MPSGIKELDGIEWYDERDTSRETNQSPAQMHKKVEAGTIRCINSRGASRHRRGFLMTEMIADTINRSSPRAIPCDDGKYGAIRRICASLSK